MPTSSTSASPHRATHTRRTRLRRGIPGSVAAEGTRSSGDSEGKPEEGEATAGLVNSECRFLYADANTIRHNLYNAAYDSVVFR